MKLCTSPAAFAAAILIFAGSAAGAAPPLPIKKHESYAAARTELMRAGWKPVISDERFADGTPEREFGDAGEMVQAGWTETVYCSGTGLNYCEFRWRKGSACLDVWTQGDYYPPRQSPHVARWSHVACSDRKPLLNVQQ